MLLGNGLYKLDENEIKLLNNNLEVISCFSIKYIWKDFDEAMFDFNSLIDSYDNYCHSKFDSYWFTCTMYIETNIIYKTDLQIITTLYKYANNNKLS